MTKAEWDGLIIRTIADYRKGLISEQDMLNEIFMLTAQFLGA